MYALGVALSVIFVITALSTFIGTVVSICDDDISKEAMRNWMLIFVVSAPAAIYCVLTTMMIGPPS